MEDDRRSQAMLAMAVDAVTAEVTTALARAGVESLVLKGPTFAAWLYDEGTVRPYVDTDVLVDPARLRVAEATLGQLGFRREFGPLPHSGMESPPASPWRRARSLVDLHETLPGAAADPGLVWAVLRAGHTEQSIAGTTAQVLGVPARLAHVALHAAHHGFSVERPLRDLSRALSLLPDEQWVGAAKVAERIGAAEAFAAGLSMLPDGCSLASRLGLRTQRPAASNLMHTRAPLASGIERLIAAPGARSRARIMRDELLPSPRFMRWWTPVARRGRRGLMAAYLWRIAYLARHAPTAIVSSRRARRAGARKS